MSGRLAVLGDAGPRWFDADRTELPLDERVVESPRLCGISLNLVTTIEPLRANTYYTLQPGHATRNGAHYTPELSWSFVTEDVTQRTPVRFDISGTHHYFQSDGASCWTHRGTGLIELTITASRPTWAWIEAWGDEGVFGFRESSYAIFGKQANVPRDALPDTAWMPSASTQLHVPTQEGAPLCANLTFHDWAGYTQKETRVCADDDGNFVGAVTTEVTTLPDERAIPRGGGCSLSHSLGDPSAMLWVIAALGLLAFRRRQAAPSSCAAPVGCVVALGCAACAGETAPTVYAGFLEPPPEELVCEPGFADCDGDAHNGCEGDLEGGEHCGACGNDCAGAACWDGQCGTYFPEVVRGDVCDFFADPQRNRLYLMECSGELSVYDEKSDEFERLFTPDSPIRFLAADAAHLYFFEEQRGLARVSLTNGQRDLLLVNPLLVFVAVSDEHVYFNVETGLHRMLKDGLGLERLDEYATWALTGDGARACWYAISNARIECSSGERFELEAYELTLLGEKLFACTADGVVSLDLEKGTLRALSSRFPCRYTAASEHGVSWSTGDALFVRTEQGPVRQAAWDGFGLGRSWPGRTYLYYVDRYRGAGQYQDALTRVPYR